MYTTSSATKNRPTVILRAIDFIDIFVITVDHTYLTKAQLSGMSGFARIDFIINA